jgi:hypothetical protein
MTSAFTGHPSGQRSLKSGCSGSLRGFIVDSAQCEATICSFASSLGDCHFDAPTAAGNHQDGFSKGVFRLTIEAFEAVIESTVLTGPHRRRRSMLRAAALARGQWRETARMAPPATRQSGTTRFLLRLVRSACG